MLSITIIAGYLGMLWMLYQAVKDGSVSGEAGVAFLIVGSIFYSIVSGIATTNTEPSSMFDLCYACKSMWWVVVGILGGHLVTKWRMERFQ